MRLSAEGSECATDGGRADETHGDGTGVGTFAVAVLAVADDTEAALCSGTSAAAADTAEAATDGGPEGTCGGVGSDVGAAGNDSAAGAAVVVVVVGRLSAAVAVAAAGAAAAERRKDACRVTLTMAGAAGAEAE